MHVRWMHPARPRPTHAAKSIARFDLDVHRAPRLTCQSLCERDCMQSFVEVATLDYEFHGLKAAKAVRAASAAALSPRTIASSTFVPSSLTRRDKLSYTSFSAS